MCVTQYDLPQRDFPPRFYSCENQPLLVVEDGRFEDYDGYAQHQQSVSYVTETFDILGSISKVRSPMTASSAIRPIVANVVRRHLAGRCLVCAACNRQRDQFIARESST